MRTLARGIGWGLVVTCMIAGALVLGAVLGGAVAGI
jgi:hypothetical protein